MFSEGKLQQIGASTLVLDFARFLHRSRGDQPYPNYKALDLMQAHRLVPNVWVVDIRGGYENGLLFHFSGTKIDEQYGYNVTGKTWEDCYTGRHRDLLLDDLYRPGCRDHRAVYVKRYDFYVADQYKKFRSVETTLVPCQSQSGDFDFSIGVSNFELCSEEFEPFGCFVD